MKTKIDRKLVAAIALLALVGCNRAKVESSRVSLQVPASISEKAVNASAALELRHLVVQVTGSDLTEPISVILDANGDTSLPSEVALDIPAGTQKLIQVLGAYSAAGVEDSVSIYYGDVSKTFSGGTATVDIPLNLLTTNTIEQAKIKGRYLTADNSGPTGTLKMVYRPTGKPALLVDKRSMVAGWFEATVLSIPMDYILPDQSFLAEQWTVSSIATSANLVKIATPTNYRRDWGSYGPTWKTVNAENKLIGYFAKDATLLANKKVCVKGTTYLGNGSLFLGNNFLSINQLKPVPVKFFPAGTTAQTSSAFASVIGGVDAASCTGLLATDEYKNYIRILPDSMDNQMYQGIEFLAGLSGFNGMVNQGPPAKEGNPTYRYSTLVGGDSNGSYLGIKFLPGITKEITSFQIYTRSNSMMMPMGNYSEPCEPRRLKNSGWQYLRTNALPASTDDFVKIRIGDLGFTPDSTVSYSICLSKNEEPLGNQIPFWSYPFTAVPFTTINLYSYGKYNMNYNPIANECRTLQVQLSTSASAAYNPFSAFAVTVVSRDGSNIETPVLYSTPDCSGTPVSSLVKAFDPSSTYTELYYKSSNTGPLNIAIENNNAGLTNSGSYSTTVDPLPSSATSLTVGTKTSADYINSYSPRLFAGGCYPMTALALSSLNQPVISSGSATMTWTYLDGVTSYTPPSGVRFVNNCVSKTTISPSLTFSNSSEASFAIDVGATSVENAMLNITAFSTTKSLTINLAPVAHHIAVTLPNGSTSSPQTGSCQAIDFSLSDSTGNAVSLPSYQKAYFYVTTQPESYTNTSTEYINVSFYTDDACSIGTNGALEFSGGQSKLTLYMKPNNLGRGYVGYYSDSVETTAAGGTDQTNRVLITPVQ